MLDWEGLLKFSLKHSDGTKKSDFKEMTSQNKVWLEQAMQEFCNSEIKRIQNILITLEDFKQLTQQNTYELLEQLQELLDSLDKGEALYKIGGHVTLLKIIFYSESAKCKEIALQIYSSANQNDAKVQNWSINTGALQMIDLLKKEKNMKLRQNLLSAISATLRGENLEAKRIFIKIKGLELLQQQNKDASQKLNNKIKTLWRDLLYYDDKLHKTHNDLSSFSNTANIKAQKKQNYDLKYDANHEFQQINELQQNAKYKGCVKKFLQSNKQLFQGYLAWLKVQISYENEQ